MSSSSASSPDLMFGKFSISKDHVFYKSDLSSAIVNLRPLIPGHSLVMPNRPNLPTMSLLTEEEHDDLFRTVRKVQQILTEIYPKATAFNVAVQDGKDAGQSVPHVHVHILPRHTGDYENNDDIYSDLDNWTPWETVKKVKGWEPVDDSKRVDRTFAMMAEEASSYRTKGEEIANRK